jgi:SPP1 gp7 family putative phage head morphogenesis protein
MPIRTKQDLFLLNAKSLGVDPTRTTLLRNQFSADISRRFRKLRDAVVDFMDDKDALGLKDRRSFIILVQPREYEFRTDSGKLQAFNDWLLQQMAAGILSPPEGADPTQPWTWEYIDSSYRKGLTNAYFESKKTGHAKAAGIGQTSKEQFLALAFAQPETRFKVQLLATRSYELLKGVNATMGSEMNRILAQGMIDGIGPVRIAKQMADKIDSLTRARALTIAHTEVIYAHAEGQLDAFEKLGVSELGVKAEWSTALDGRVCPLCAAMEGRMFKIEASHGMIPLHPRCRCSWKPAMVTEDRKKVLKGVDTFRKKMGLPPATKAEQNAILR